MKEQIVGNAQELQYVLPPMDSENGPEAFRSFWSSPEELAKRVRTLKESCWYKDIWTEENGFYGVSMKEALKMAEDGWKEGAERIEKVLAKVKAQNPFRKKPIKYGIVGSVPDVARAVSGNPLNMKNIDLTKASRRQVITLISDIGALGGVDSENFINRAAVITAIIDELESCGYACDVISVSTCNDGGGSFWGSLGNGGQVQVAVQVKNSNQPLDITRLAFGVGHPSMFRRLIWAERTGHPATKTILGHVGCTVRLDYKDLAERNIYHLPTTDNSVFETEEKAIDKGVQECVECLQKQGFKGFGPPAEKVVETPKLDASQPRKAPKQSKQKIKMNNLANTFHAA